MCYYIATPPSKTMREELILYQLIVCPFPGGGSEAPGGEPISPWLHASKLQAYDSIPGFKKDVLESIL